MFFILELFTKYERVCLITVRHRRVIWSSKIPYGDRPRCEVHHYLHRGHRLGFVRTAPLSLDMARHASQPSLVRVSGGRKWKWSRVTGTAWPVWGEVSVAGRGAWHACGQHADSMTVVRRGCATPSEDWFSSKFCDLRSRAALSNADVSLGWADLSSFALFALCPIGA